MRNRNPPKLVHKLMFSMPPGSPPQKVLAAVRNFAREEFFGQHRYAFVLHTDEPHPHVHLVLKAVSEQGVRLNIRKATLRHWRSQFASHLRGLGVAANATERAVRGESRSARRDGIYRASIRGESTFMRTRVETVAREVASGVVRADTGKRSLLETRAEVAEGWKGAAELLARSGERGLAADVARFARALNPPTTDRDLLVKELVAIPRSRLREPPTFTNAVR